MRAMKEIQQTKDSMALTFPELRVASTTLLILLPYINNVYSAVYCLYALHRRSHERQRYYMVT